MIALVVLLLANVFLSIIKSKTETQHEVSQHCVPTYSAFSVAEMLRKLITVLFGTSAMMNM